MADERTFVIVGASLAGAQAAQQLRKAGFMMVQPAPLTTLDAVELAVEETAPGTV